MKHIFGLEFVILTLLNSDEGLKGKDLLSLVFISFICVHIYKINMYGNISRLVPKVNIRTSLRTLIKVECQHM